MESTRKIFAAGSILVDHINAIDGYPSAGELTQIRTTQHVPGGLVPNTGCDIHTLAPEIPVWAAGGIGDDGDGKFVVGELRRSGLDVSCVTVLAGEPTSFTEVMSVTNGERTFFTYPGASAQWGYDDFPFDRVNPGDIVLLGYFLLLAKVDAGDGLKILKELKRRGAMTAIDLVTENSDRYKLVVECLPYVDYLILNETEAARIAGETADEATLCRKLLAMGVRERVVIHSPTKGVTCTPHSEPVEVASFRLPPGFIKGKTGAGDAYCAGALVGIFRGLDDAAILRTGRAAAVGALSAPGATEGMRALDELNRMTEGLSC